MSFLLSLQDKYIQCSDVQDEIQWYQVRAGWIFHGSVGWFTSIFSGVTGNPTTHWWVIIKTKKGKYYCSQYTGGTVQLRQYSSFSSAQYRGKQICWGFSHNWPQNISVKYSYSPSTTKMQHVINFIQNDIGLYMLVGNNCQDYGTRFYNAI